MNKTVLVSGGSGFVGGHLVDRLIELGYQVKVIDDYSSGTYQHPKAEYFPFDISKLSQMDLCNILKDVKCVIHLAAKARVQPSYDNILRYNEVNVTGTLNLLETCRQSGIKDFIFASSSSVYGNKWTNDFPSEEFDDLSPISPYAYQKELGERYCQLYDFQFGFNCRILRFFNVYGERMIPGGQYRQAIRIFLDNYSKGEPFQIFGAGDQRRDFTYVGDIVDGIILSMEKDVRGIFNLGSGENHSINELVEMINPDGIADYFEAKKEPMITLANNNLARNVLGWEPKMKLKDWIKSQL